jgi:hypothetical protein
MLVGEAEDLEKDSREMAARIINEAASEYRARTGATITREATDMLVRELPSSVAANVEVDPEWEYRLRAGTLGAFVSAHALAPGGYDRGGTVTIGEDLIAYMVLPWPWGQK